MDDRTAFWIGVVLSILLTGMWLPKEAGANESAGRLGDDPNRIDLTDADWKSVKLDISGMGEHVQGLAVNEAGGNFWVTAEQWTDGTARRGHLWCFPLPTEGQWNGQTIRHLGSARDLKSPEVGQEAWTHPGGIDLVKNTLLIPLANSMDSISGSHILRFNVASGDFAEPLSFPQFIGAISFWTDQSRVIAFGHPQGPDAFLHFCTLPKPGGKSLLPLPESPAKIAPEWGWTYDDLKIKDDWLVCSGSNAAHEGRLHFHDLSRNAPVAFAPVPHRYQVRHIPGNPTASTSMMSEGMDLIGNTLYLLPELREASNYGEEIILYKLSDPCIHLPNRR